MATLIHGATFDGTWPPDAIAGGTIGTRLANKMIYVSDEGFTVTIKGTGLLYDDDGLPTGGTVTGIVIEKAGTTFATFSGISVDFARAGMLIFGYDRDNGRHQEPDTWSLWHLALAKNDLVTGSADWDDMRGGFGNDTINGGDGGDYIADESGTDIMDGGADFDTLSYDEANWSWQSFRGVNLDAATGKAKDPWGFTDTFSNFERYKDTLFSDTLRGSDIDYEQFVINRGSDIVDGRGGWDVLSFQDADRWGAHRGVRVNLDTGVARDSWKNTDTISNIEEVRGTIFDDTITGSLRDEEFLGSRGLDVIDGAGGWDHLAFWDSGDDGIGHGIVINTSLAANVQDDGYGNTETALGIESYGGTQFGDRFTGANNTDNFNGDDGNDTLNGGGGEDFLEGGWGRDALFGGSGNTDHLSGGGDNDTLTGNGGDDNFNFVWDLVDSGVDTITDFVVNLDRIYVGNWWGGGFADEFLVANQFRSGAGVTTANSASQRFIYNTTTGDLYFDADGNGTGASAVRFATLSNLAALTFADIHIQF